MKQKGFLLSEKLNSPEVNCNELGMGLGMVSCEVFAQSKAAEVDVPLTKDNCRDVNKIN